MDQLGENNIYELIIKFLSGESTPGEDAYILSWKKQSERNKLLFNQIRNVWISSSQLKFESSFNSQSALHTVHRKMNVNLSFQMSKFFNRFSKIAALFILVFAFGGIISIFIYSKLKVQQRAAICRYEAPKGSRAIAYLPDGTKVWLNAESILEYSADFNVKKREVKLTGEGYFKVKSDRSKPFIVHADNLAIKAYGTAFNIKAYPEENHVTTTLEEGEVKIEGKAGGNKSFAFSMKPKQKIVYFKDAALLANQQPVPHHEVEAAQNIDQKIEEIKPKPEIPIESDVNVRTELYTSWKDSLWIIQKEKLDDLAILLERRYNVSISFMSDELKKYRFSGIIQNETLEQVFEILRLTMPVSYSIDKGLVTVTLDQSLKKKYKSAYLK